MKGPIIIGPGCFIGAHAYLRGGVYLDEKVVIGPGCEIKSSFLFRGSALAHFNFAGDSIIGEGVNMEAGSILANHYNERDDKSIRALINGSDYTTAGYEIRIAHRRRLKDWRKRRVVARYGFGTAKCSKAARIGRTSQRLIRTDISKLTRNEKGHLVEAALFKTFNYSIRTVKFSMHLHCSRFQMLPLRYLSRRRVARSRL